MQIFSDDPVRTMIVKLGAFFLILLNASPSAKSQPAGLLTEIAAANRKLEKKFSNMHGIAKMSSFIDKAKLTLLAERHREMWLG